jgi:tetratricopeptide (TPR) repeat protein
MKVGERSQIINQLFEAKKWVEARTVLYEWLKNNPDDHWTLTRLSSTYAEECNYSKAMEYLEQALMIEPRCPLALSDYTEALAMLGRDNDAIRVCKNLIARGAKRIAYGKCGQGLPWSRGLINDSRYYLGMLYGSQGNFSLARKYFKAHIANRNRNCRSVHKLNDVRKMLTAIEQNQYPG